MSNGDNMVLGVSEDHDYQDPEKKMDELTGLVEDKTDLLSVDEVEASVPDLEDILPDTSGTLSDMIQEEMDKMNTEAELRETEAESEEVIPVNAPPQADPERAKQGRRFLEHYGIDTSTYSDEEVVEKLVKIRAAKSAAVQVLSRGQVLDGIDRLMAFVPRGFIGELKSETDLSHQRALAMGWKVFVDSKAKLESSTGGADGRVRIGDQILYIMPEEIYIALRLAKAERLAVRRAANPAKKGPQQQVTQEGGLSLFDL